MGLGSRRAVRERYAMHRFQNAILLAACSMARSPRSGCPASWEAQVDIILLP